MRLTEDVAEQPMTISQLDDLTHCKRKFILKDLPTEQDTLAEHRCAVHASMHVFSRMPTWNETNTVGALQMYVDGSLESGGRKAGWLVVGIGVVRSNWQFVGYFADQVYATSHMQWLGNDENSAHVARHVTPCTMRLLMTVRPQACLSVRQGPRSHKHVTGSSRVASRSAAGIPKPLSGCHALSQP